MNSLIFKYNDGKFITSDEFDKQLLREAEVAPSPAPAEPPKPDLNTVFGFLQSVDLNEEEINTFIRNVMVWGVNLGDVNIAFDRTKLTNRGTGVTIKEPVVPKVPKQQNPITTQQPEANPSSKPQPPNKQPTATSTALDNKNKLTNDDNKNKPPNKLKNV